MKPDLHIPQSLRLLDQLREVLRYKQYSLRTEQAYLHWVRFFLFAGMAATARCGTRRAWPQTRSVPS